MTDDWTELTDEWEIVMLQLQIFPSKLILWCKACNLGNYISLLSLCFQVGFSNVVFWEEDWKVGRQRERVLSVGIVFLFVLPSPVNVISLAFSPPSQYFVTHDSFPISQNQSHSVASETSVPDDLCPFLWGLIQFHGALFSFRMMSTVKQPHFLKCMNFPSTEPSSQASKC